MIQLNNH